MCSFLVVCGLIRHCRRLRPVLIGVVSGVVTLGALRVVCVTVIAIGCLVIRRLFLSLSVLATH